MVDTRHTQRIFPFLVNTGVCRNRYPRGTQISWSDYWYTLPTGGTYANPVSLFPTNGWMTFLELLQSRGTTTNNVRVTQGRDR